MALVVAAPRAHWECYSCGSPWPFAVVLAESPDESGRPVTRRMVVCRACAVVLTRWLMRAVDEVPARCYPPGFPIEGRPWCHWPD